jgi:hypothetical protein
MLYHHASCIIIIIIIITGIPLNIVDLLSLKRSNSSNNNNSHPSSLIPINEYEVFYDLCRDDKSFLDNLSRKEGHVCSEKVTATFNTHHEQRSGAVGLEGLGDGQNSLIFNRWVNSNNNNDSNNDSNINSNIISSSSSEIAAAVESKKRLFYEVFPTIILIVFVIRQNIPDEILHSDGSFREAVVTSW